MQFRILRLFQHSHLLLFLASSPTSESRRQASLQHIFIRTTFSSQNTFSVDHRSDPLSCTRRTPLLYHRPEPIDMVILFFLFCIRRRPNRHHLILIHRLRTPPTDASTLNVKLSSRSHLFHRVDARLIQPWLHLPVARFCHTYYKSLHVCPTERTYPVHGVNTTPSTTYCTCTHTYRHEGVPLSKKRGPIERPVLSTAI